MNFSRGEAVSRAGYGYGTATISALVPPRKGPGRAGFEPALVPARPELEKFRENLVRGMIAKQLTASDVARAMWGSSINAQGNSVAKGRDRMTHYLSGSTYPSPENISKLCEVLDLTVDDLAMEPEKANLPRAAVPVPASPASTMSNNYDPVLDAVLTFQIRDAGFVDVTFQKRMSQAQAFAWLEFTRKLVLDPPETGEP